MQGTNTLGAMSRKEITAQSIPVEGPLWPPSRQFRVTLVGVPSSSTEHRSVEENSRDAKMCSHVVILAGSSREPRPRRPRRAFYSVINSIYLRPVHRRIHPWYNLSVCRASLSRVRLVANSRPFKNLGNPSILITVAVVQSARDTPVPPPMAPPFLSWRLSPFDRG